MTRIEQIISGGQTGVDQAALRAARAIHCPTGGWMPRGFKTDDGPAPDIALLYSMDEHPSDDYAPRTRRNVLDSDATLILGNKQSPGCTLTINYCETAGKPYFVQGFQVRGPSANGIVEWLDGLPHRVVCLNVAGNRERKFPGIGEWAEEVVRQLLVRRFQCRSR